MKTKIFLIVIMGIILFFTPDCKKEEQPTNPEYDSAKSGKPPYIRNRDIINVTTSSATFSVTIYPNGLHCVVYFKYGLECAVYRDSVLATPRTINADSTIEYSATAKGLKFGTDYYWTAVATNQSGTSEDGCNICCMPGGVPNVTTLPATDISRNGAILNGTAYRNMFNTIVTFEYGTSTSYGQIVQAIPGQIEGDSVYKVNATLTGLTENTIYHARVHGKNEAGEMYGSDISFVASDVQTQPATNTTATQATLNGIVNARDLSTIVTFEYGTSTTYGQEVSAEQSPVSGNTSINVSAIVTGLTGNTYYHYRVKTVNSLGTAYGSDSEFLICTQCPIVTTLAATDVRTDSVKTRGGGYFYVIKATLHGTVYANGLPATVTFVVGGYYGGRPGMTVTALQSPVPSDSITNVSADFSGPSYIVRYFRIIATNACGKAYGNWMKF